MSDGGLLPGDGGGSIDPRGDYRTQPDGFRDGGSVEDSLRRGLKSCTDQFLAQRQRAAKEWEDKLRRVQELAARRQIMIEYLQMKEHEQDWHGVQDAASDLRDIDSELKGLNG